MTSVEITRRMSAIPPSGIRRVTDEVSRLEKTGRRIINLTIGRPDFDTPEHIKAAAQKALSDGFVHYTNNRGIDELREALSDKFRAENNVDYSVSEIIVTVGANEAVSMAITAMLDEGDEVLAPDPSWPHYKWCAAMVGAKPVDLPIIEANQFGYDPDQIESLITPRTRMLIINTPHNPSGSVTDISALERIAELAVRHNLVVVADEIYEKLVYDDAKHYSIASLPGMKERTITINGFSKAYSMTGWRLGYVAAPQNMTDAMLRVHQYTTTCATSFAQKGAVAAVTGPQDCVEMMRQEFDRRRRLLAEKIPQIPGLRLPQVPKGAFYAFIDCRGLGVKSDEANSMFLQEAGVAMVPGTAFGNYGEGYLRLAYSASYDDIAEALVKMEEVVKQKNLG